MRYDEIVNKMMSNQKDITKGKSYEEQVELYTKAFDVPPKTLEEINRAGKAIKDDWQELQPLSAEEQEKRRALVKRINQVSISLGVCNCASENPGTDLRYPEEHMMKKIRPDKPVLSEEDKAYNQHIVDVLRNPKENVTEYIRLHRDMMKRFETQNIDKLLEKDLSDSELVERAEDVLTFGSAVRELDRMKKEFVLNGFLKDANTVNTGTITHEKDGKKVETPLTEEDIALLEDFHRLKNKYERFTDHMDALERRLGVIQNPHYALFDCDSPAAAANFSNPTIAYQISDEKEEALGYKLGGALSDIAIECYGNATAAVNGEKELIKDYFKSKGVPDNDLVIQFSNDKKEYSFRRKMSDLQTFRDGEYGYATVYSKNNPKDFLLVRADGKDHMIRQIAGAEGIIGEPTSSQKPVPAMAKPKKPNFFKRVLNTLFGAYKKDIEKYRLYEKAAESDKRVSEYKKTVDAENESRKQKVDEKLKSIEKRKPAKEQPEKSADMVDISACIQKNITALAKGKQSDLEFQKSVLELETCCVFAGKAEPVTAKDFLRCQKELAAKTPKVNASLKDKVQAEASRLKDGSALVSGSRMINAIHEYQAQSKAVQRRVQAPARTLENAVRKQATPQLAAR